MKLRSKGVRKAHADKLQEDIEKELESNRIYESEYSVDISFDVSAYMIISDLASMFEKIDEDWDTDTGHRTNTTINFNVWLQTNKTEEELEFIKERIVNHIVDQGGGYVYDNVHVNIRSEGKTLIEDKNKTPDAETDLDTRNYTRINTRGKHVRRKELSDGGRSEGCDEYGIPNTKSGHAEKSSGVQDIHKVTGEWVILPKQT